MNWVLTILGSIVGSIILAVAGNLVTDKFKQWLAERSLINRTKRIQELEKQIARVKKLHADPQQLQNENEAFILILIGQISLMFGAGISGLTLLLISINPNQFIGFLDIPMQPGEPILLILGWGAMLIGLLVWATISGTISGHLKNLLAVLEFEKYEKEAENRLQELSRGTGKKKNKGI